MSIVGINDVSYTAARVATSRTKTNVESNVYQGALYNASAKHKLLAHHETKRTGKNVNTAGAQRNGLQRTDEHNEHTDEATEQFV